MASKYLLLAIFIGGVCAQTEPSVSDVLKALPADLQSTVNESQVQDLQNKTTKLFKEKCEKNGGPDAYTNAETAFKNFSKCIQDLVDFSVLNGEIEEAKPNGQVDEVFKKYCEKTPLFKNCVRNMTESVKPCLTPDERANLKTVHNVSEQLAEFICYKEGDRIALFIAEKGPDCVMEKETLIHECVNKTFGTAYNFDPKNFSADSIPQIAFGEKECNQLTELQTCVVAALETCPVPTSANIVESLFKFVRKATPCKDMPVSLCTC
ncbi:unnamed protein product [Parnassius apollo]|uniref:(apollo) hypothetical protein n=1 Tax=Parnassius apollo TaxID=110799 RepID=A0A8S3W5E4_PARAO|nr:unnamed protein product [Parnassius apollo]